jgi:hypothetical protein
VGSHFGPDVQSVGGGVDLTGRNVGLWVAARPCVRFREKFLCGTFFPKESGNHTPKHLKKRQNHFLEQALGFVQLFSQILEIIMESRSKRVATKSRRHQAVPELDFSPSYSSCLGAFVVPLLRFRCAGGIPNSGTNSRFSSALRTGC